MNIKALKQELAIKYDEDDPTLFSEELGEKIKSFPGLVGPQVAGDLDEPAIAKIKEALSLSDRDTSADVMSELLMDDE